MSPEMILVIAVAVFAVLAIMEAPIGIAIAVGAVVGTVMLDGPAVAASVAGTSAFNAVSSYSLFIIPMYILMGSLISNSVIARDLYAAIHRVVRKLPGGLAATAVLATGAFSGISGSSAADVAVIGRMSVREMVRHGYDRAYAAAIVAAAGMFASLIPPSLLIVLYGIVAQESIGALILAAVIPGCASAAILATFVVVREVILRRRGSVSAPSEDVQAEVTGITQGMPLPTPEKHGVRGLLYAALIFAIVIGGMGIGLFTATEAGAIGAFTALVLVVVSKKVRDRSAWLTVRSSLKETAETTGMIFLLVIGATMFTYLIASSRFPMDATAWVTSLNVDPKVIVLLFLLILLPLGLFLDGLSIMLLTIPIMAPIVEQMGFSGVWFAILALKMIEIGLITPPVGLNVFVISSVSGVEVSKVFNKVLPFVLIDLAFTGVLFLFPEIILWLPGVAGML